MSGPIPGGGMMFVKEDGGVDFFRLAALKAALKMEMHGMRVTRGPTAYSIAKKQYGLRGTRQAVWEQLQAMVEEAVEKRAKEASGE